MAGLTRKRPAPFTIEKIKTGPIVKRLIEHILSDQGSMTGSQVTAALGLLKKVHPDLAAQKVDLTGNVSIEVLQVAAHKTPK